MPKAYSEKEREIIQQNLKEAALACMVQYGIRKTTVDEIVKRVKIPKGTFYLFYQSKELLLFDALLEVHNQIQEDMIASVEAVQDNITVENLTDLIFSFFQTVNDMGLAQLTMHGDFELLIRKLPEAQLQEHFEQDALSIQRLVPLIPGGSNKDLSVYESAFRSVFLTSLYQKEIGGGKYNETVRLLIRGVVMQLMESEVR